MTRLVQCRAGSRRFLPALLLLTGMFFAGPCPARAMGVATLPALEHPADGGAAQGTVTIWYPSQARETGRTMGAFVLSGAWEGAPVRGNGALILLSHGSGGSSAPYFDMARVLVDAGFVVGAPEHDGDNWHDQSKTGPASWKQRPAEISAAIDRIQGDPRFAPLLDKKKVGVYGMSAGGLTALEFSGATWSLSRLVKHCADHLEEDARFCAYREMAAASGKLDGETLQRLKAQFVDGARSGMVDPKEYGFQDSRVKAVVAAVPVAAVIDPESQRVPRVPTALISAEMDQVLTPRWHVLALEKACPSCVGLGPLKSGGHMSVLSPLPKGVIEGLGAWAEDPPGFDRASLGPLYQSIAQFFLRLLGADKVR